MGIVGLGRIGVRVAGLARAFGMTVIAAGRPGASSPGTAERRSIPDLFAEADVASLHCPLTVENAGFVNAELLRRMKPTAFLINTARGGLVNERDLAYALKEGWLAGAALDVVSSEPMTPQNPLRDAPSCIVTPHIAWASLAARRRLMATTVESVRAFLAGQPANVVN
jgi:glycerate dehydrogenase